eukprot:5674406-Amphidinium_carterae.1
MNLALALFYALSSSRCVRRWKFNLRAPSPFTNLRLSLMDSDSFSGADSIYHEKVSMLCKKQYALSHMRWNSQHAVVFRLTCFVLLRAYALVVHRLNGSSITTMPEQAYPYGGAVTGSPDTA